MTTNGIKAVLFDLDGTLVDSAGDLAASVNHALSLIDKPSLSEQTIRSYIGNGADRLIHRAITLDYEGEAPSHIYQPAREAFLSHYANNVCMKTALYPSVSSVLNDLTEEAYLLACVTNKPSQFTAPLLDALGIKHLFNLVLCGDSLERKKPAPDQLQYAANEFGLQEKQCLMVGDTNTDISAALNCDMPAVFVTYGYGEPADLDARFSGPHINRMTELHEYLDTSS